MGKHGLRTMNGLVISVMVVGLSVAGAMAQVPKVFQGLLEKDVAVKGQVGMVMPPPEIDKYVAKVEQAARKDVEWFREYSKNAKPGVPLPFHEKLGLTQAEYDDYLKLWAKREFKSMEEVILILRQSSDKNWSITATGSANPLSTLRLDVKTGDFRSPNGVLKRIEDIKVDEASILGAWTAAEWRFEEETGLGKMKENVAVGKFVKPGYGLIVYRVQEVSSEGTRLMDKSLVVRFALGAAGKLKAEQTPAKKK